MKRLVGVIIVILVIFTFAACRQPVGSLSGGGGVGSSEFLLVKANRILFDTEQWYRPVEDLKIMYNGDGALKEIQYDTPGVEIVLREHYKGDYPNAIPLPPSGEIKLNTAGSHEIVVRYRNKTDSCVIEVRGTYSGGGDESDLFDTVWL